MRASDLYRRVALVVPLALMAGCNLLTDARNSDTSSNEAWEQSTNLSGEFGGYDFEAELPAFGDTEILKMDGQEASVELSGEDRSIVDEPGAFALRIVWGQLEGNRDATEPVDWSGSISVTSGAVAVLRTIAFEYPHDHLLHRDSRQELGFVSHTLPHYDGLLLVIKDGGDPEATLTFATGPLNETIRLSELRDIDRAIRVRPEGNAVAFTGIELDFDPACPHGGLRGEWVLRSGERGVFRGAWVTALGEPIGHLRGHFGINDDGRRVWFAKIIDRAGEVVGLARGAWRPSDDLERPGGVFEGHWMAREGEIRGAVAGQYVATRHGDDAVAGVFSGRWRTACEPTEPPADEPPAEEPPAEEPPSEPEPGSDAP